MTTEKVKEYLGIYAAFSRNLRAWLVAYGVGAPVLLVSQESVTAKLAANANSELVAKVFLAGVGVQIFSALLYKSTVGKLYMAEVKLHEKSGLYWRFSLWLYKQLWLEMVFDVATLVLYAIATQRTIVALAKPIVSASGS